MVASQSALSKNDLLNLFDQVEKVSTGNFAPACTSTNDSNTCSLMAHPEIPGPIDLLGRPNGVKAADNFMNGDLDLFWAQNITGADLARDLVDNMEESQNKKVSVAVIDSSFGKTAFDGIPEANFNIEGSNFKTCSNEFECESPMASHGNSVANLVAGNKVGGVSPSKVILTVNTPGSQTFDSNTPPNVAEEYLKFFGNYEKSQTPIPKFINSSQDWNDTNGIIPKKLGEMNAQTRGQGPIMVTISHNSYPQPVEPAKKNPHSIIVGNASIWGTSAGSSQEDDDVVISAPSDEWVLTAGRNIGGKVIYTSHGGTSNAAPQVTGALANLSLIKPDLTRDQSVRLLKMSAYPSYVSGGKNGAGVLNSYKMARVLSKIVKECKSSSNKSKCENDLIANDSSFDFPDERAKRNKILDDAKSLIQEIKNAGDQCEIVQARFKALRELSLLFPDDLEIAKLMADIYKAQGLKTSARFYEGLVANGKKPPLSAANWLLSEWDHMTDLEKGNFGMAIRKFNENEFSALIDKLEKPDTKIPPYFWQNSLFKLQAVVNPHMTEEKHLRLICVLKKQTVTTPSFIKDYNQYIRRSEIKVLHDRCPN